MRTAIITDSNSGIFEQEGREMGVFVIPMPVILDGVTYFEGKDISHDDFFRWLSEGKPVATSQPNIADVIRTWDTVLESGYEEAVYIPMSSGLSGSCHMAQGMAQEYEDRIVVVDNHRISVTLRHAVQDAVSLREQGLKAAQIKETLEKTAYDSIVYVGVGTLEYLKASGRVTSAGAALGTILNIKPLLVIEGERLDAYAKVRGTISCQKRLIQAMQGYAEKLLSNGSEIRIGVAGSFADPAKNGEWQSSVKEASSGAGDQGMMFGFACRETENFMPLPIELAHGVVKRLERVRRTQELPYLLPDGKAQVTVEYDGEKPKRVSTVILSTQHCEDADIETIRKDVKQHIIIPTIPKELLDKDTQIFINPTGRFVVGGLAGDSGLTGRKLIVDTYGGYARHGGGSFSGKDPTKVDRSGAYMARYIAKNIVAAGLADKCEVQLSYSIGLSEPVSVRIDTFGTEKMVKAALYEVVRKQVDLRPAAIIQKFGLTRPIYASVSCYGHFGSNAATMPWEQTDLAEYLKKVLN